LNGRPWVLAETNWEAVRSTGFEVAILPWGATEAHNRHLPYGTDTIEAQRLAEEAARLAWERGTRAIVLPPVPFGVNTMQLDIPLTVNMNPSTQLSVVADITHSLERVGILKLVIVNGHGGNDFRFIIRELQPETEVFLCTLNWWQAADAAAHFPNPGDHAGQMETSVMLHLAPELVLPVMDAGTGTERLPRIRALREGWAWTPRRWTQVTGDTGIGDPAGASSETGARFTAEIAARIAEFLVELAAADTDSLYE
jgi:creatinine amidohydrolase